jgi:hypothetical protein
MYNKTPKKFVSGQYQDVSCHLDWDDQMTRHILIGKLGSQGEKKDPLLIFNILPFGRVENMWCMNG